MQNLRPGDGEKMGFGYEDMKAMINEAYLEEEQKGDRLIYTSISGYGSDGPYMHKKAYDLLIQAEAGLVCITGTDGEMAKVGRSIADIAAGVYAYSSVMAATCRGRKRSEDAWLMCRYWKHWLSGWVFRCTIPSRDSRQPKELAHHMQASILTALSRLWLEQIAKRVRK